MPWSDTLPHLVKKTTCSLHLFLRGSLTSCLEERGDTFLSIVFLAYFSLIVETAFPKKEGHVLPGSNSSLQEAVVRKLWDFFPLPDTGDVEGWQPCQQLEQAAGNTGSMGTQRACSPGVDPAAVCEKRTETWGRRKEVAKGGDCPWHASDPPQMVPVSKARRTYSKMLENTGISFNVNVTTWWIISSVKAGVWPFPGPCLFQKVRKAT